MILFKVPKHNSGFSLIEALIALVVLGILLGSIFSFQSQLIRGVFRAHAIVEHIPIIKNALVAVERDQLYAKEGVQKIENKESDATITYQISKIAESSSLASVKNLKKETITAQWPSLFTTGEIEFVSFRFFLPSTAKA